MSAFYTSEVERRNAASARPLVRKLAAQLNVNIEERFSGGWHEILLTAPDGYWFAGAGIHEQVIANAGACTDQLWTRALSTLRDADVQLHTDDACEWCHEEVE